MTALLSIPQFLRLWTLVQLEIVLRGIKKEMAELKRGCVQQWKMFRKLVLLERP